jgi:serine/threonine protein kinase
MAQDRTDREETVPGSPSPTTGPDPAADDLLADLRRRWLQGDRTPAEGYLERLPARGRGQTTAVDLVYAEFMLREQLGETPRPEEYLGRFPQFADALRRQFELHELLREGFGSTGDAPPTAEDTEAARSAVDFLAPPERPDEIGRLGGYRILKELDSGGMGVVFLAEDPSLGRPVALKVIRPGQDNRQARERFLREARAAAAAEHEHVVAIHQVGEDRGVPFLVMPLLKGESLEERLRRQDRLTVGEVLRIGREVAEGLAAAHARGLVHRDLKPGNVWLEGERGSVKILDFGLARSAKGEAPLTQANAVLGTAEYMSPEQAAGAGVDARSDLFSLGTVLYRAATGKRPFWREDFVATLNAVRKHQPPPPGRLQPDLPEALDRLIRRLHAKDPARRPESAAEVAVQLKAIEQGATAAVTPVPPTPTPAPRPPAPKPLAPTELWRGIPVPAPPKPRPRPKPARKVTLKASVGGVGCALTISVAAVLLCVAVPFLAQFVGSHRDTFAPMAQVDPNKDRPFEALVKKDPVESPVKGIKEPPPPPDKDGKDKSNLPKKVVVPPPPVVNKPGPLDGTWSARFVKDGEDLGTIEVVFEGDGARLGGTAAKSKLAAALQLDAKVLIRKLTPNDGVKIKYIAKLVTADRPGGFWVDFEVNGPDRFNILCSAADAETPERFVGLVIELTRK